MKVVEMGYFGNVWVRMQVYGTKGDRHQGHKHAHDHMTLLSSGSLRVHVEGFAPVTYKAPKFFQVPAEHAHEFIPLEDNTVAYCVFALRDEDGELTDVYDGKTKQGVALGQG